MARTQQNRGLAAEIRAQDSYRAAMYDAAKEVATSVRRNTPRGSGAASRSIVITRDGNTYRVGSTDPFFHLIEFGSINNPAYAPLRRGVLTAGLRLIAT